MTPIHKPTLNPTKQPATGVSFDWLVRLPDKPKPQPKASKGK